MLPSNEISFLFFNLVNGIFIPEKNANSLYKMYQTSQCASPGAELYKLSKLLCFEWPFFVLSVPLFGEIRMGGGLGKAGDDENCTTPDKRHPHLNKILVWVEVAKTFLRDAFVYKEFRNTYVSHLKRGQKGLRN